MPQPRDRHPGAPAGDAHPKAALRAGLRAARRALGARPDEGPAPAARVLALPEVSAASTVAAYVAGPLEPATAVLVEQLRARGVRVLLPVVLPDLDLDWALDDGARRPGAGHGALEPGGPRLGPAAVTGAQVVVVPALAADRCGRRLGQGGGSYDRALARVGAGALVVALVHDGELLDEPVPVQAHDRVVHVVVTPTATLRVSSA
ncbi:MAG: 5-formyltetrahydrofolate cyclo-ligase [Rhodoferax sp.]|nr:5-formyltetrahydrofolate cyclo-ligase [Actinomycetota bacterium]